jgi:hypothetical protein
MTAAVFPYAGQYAASHPKKAEDVGIKQRPDLRTLAILDGRLIAAAGITDQHVDTVKLCFGCLHRRGNLSFVRNIEIKRKTIATTAREYRDARLMSGRDHGQHAQAQVWQALGRSRWGNR